MDTNQMVAGVMGMLMGPGGGPGGHTHGGGSHGSGAFRNFNPAQPHGSIYWQGNNSALNATPWQASNPVGPALSRATRPRIRTTSASPQAGSPYIPGLTEAELQAVRLSQHLTGHRNLNAVHARRRSRAHRYASRRTFPVPASAVATSHTPSNKVGGVDVPVQSLRPHHGHGTSGPLVSGNKILERSIRRLPRRYWRTILNAQHHGDSIPPYNNYQTISNAGNNSIAINTRYVRTHGLSSGKFALRRVRRRQRQTHSGGSHSDKNTPPTLRQNINLGYNYSHSASGQPQRSSSRSVVPPKPTATP